MRAYLIAAALIFPSAASAGSITTIKGGEVAPNSVLTIGCVTDCKVKDEKAPEPEMIKPGTLSYSLKQVDGETKVVRSENLLGGSGMTFVTSEKLYETAALKDDLKNEPSIDFVATGPVPARPNPIEAFGEPETRIVSVEQEEPTVIEPGVDRETTTAAVSGGQVRDFNMADSENVDVGNFELRLNTLHAVD